MSIELETEKTRTRRGLCKLAVVIGAALIVIAGLSYGISDQALDELKHSLSLWTIVALVIIINLVCFICFMILMAAYHWVRSDLRKGGENQLDKEEL